MWMVVHPDGAITYHRTWRNSIDTVNYHLQMIFSEPLDLTRQRINGE
jgi:hypothetical protein